MEEEGHEEDGSMDIDAMDGWYVSDEDIDEGQDDLFVRATTAEAPF